MKIILFLQVIVFLMFMVKSDFRIVLFLGFIFTSKVIDSILYF